MVSRANEARDELKVEATFKAVLKSYIECEIPNLNYNFQYVRDKIKTIKSQEYETVPTPQTRGLIYHKTM